MHYPKWFATMAVVVWVSLSHIQAQQAKSALDTLDFKRIDVSESFWQNIEAHDTDPSFQWVQFMDKNIYILVNNVSFSRRQEWHITIRYGNKTVSILLVKDASWVHASWDAFDGTGEVTISTKEVEDILEKFTDRYSQITEI